MSDAADTEVMSRTSLRILLTNNTLASRAGSELYVRDLAIELVKRGHFPIAYSPALGDVANELTKATIPVIDDLSVLAQPPDIIHGQHHLETMTAVLRFPQTPAVYVCHGWLPWEELPPIFPTIQNFVAVDDLCRERLLTTKGISPESISVIRNFVDTDRFHQRRDWASRPKSALIFSNSAHAEDARTMAITSACARIGIDRVDILGEAAGKSHPEPERVLDKYDIVFAKARCAIEAMASGAAVIVTDFAGLAGLVTSDGFGSMRSLNFGARTMQTKTITTDNILAELQRYDANDARRVSDLIRAEGSLTSAVDDWISLYRRMLGCHDRSDRPILSPGALQAMDDASRYLRFLAPVIKARGAAEAASSAAEQRASEALQALQASSSLQDELDASIRAAQARFDEHESVAAALTTRRNELENELKAQGVARELDAIKLAEMDQANAGLSRQIDSLTTEMASAILLRDSQLACLRADASREYAQLHAHFATACNQLDAIQSSRAWKVIQRYGKLKQWLRI